MAVATHNGTCQVCGRFHAVRPGRGVIAKHGYTRPHGFFQGTCAGSGELPLEKDRSVLDRVAKQFEAVAAQLEAKTIEDITMVQIRYRGETRTFASAAELEEAGDCWFTGYVNAEKAFDGMRDSRLRGLHGEARARRSHVRLLRQLVQDHHGKPLMPRRSR